MGNQPVHVVVDVETTGLVANPGYILELGILLLDYELNEIDSFSSVIADDLALRWLDHLEQLASQANAMHNAEPYRGAKIVWDMHISSGLVNDIRRWSGTDPVGHSLRQVEAAAVGFLHNHRVRTDMISLPMTGSSVLLDRSFTQEHMPALNDALFYRCVDVSSHKHLVSRYRPDIAEGVKALGPKKRHRVLDDCRDTTEELRYYLRHLYGAEGI